MQGQVRFILGMKGITVLIEFKKSLNDHISRLRKGI